MLEPAVFIRLVRTVRVATSAEGGSSPLDLSRPVLSLETQIKFNHPPTEFLEKAVQVELTNKHCGRQNSDGSLSRE